MNVQADLWKLAAEGRSADDMIDVTMRQDYSQRVKPMPGEEVEQFLGLQTGVDDQAIRDRLILADDIAVRLEVPEDQAIDLHSSHCTVLFGSIACGV